MCLPWGQERGQWGALAGEAGRELQDLHMPGSVALGPACSRAPLQLMC